MCHQETCTTRYGASILLLHTACLALVACGESPVGPRNASTGDSGLLRLAAEVADVREIGLPSGITSAVARSINDQGQVAGEFDQEWSDGSRGFFWDGQEFHGLGPNLVGLGGVAAVNDDGQVAGILNFDFASPFFNAVCHPAIWQDDVVTDLGNLPDGECADASDINDVGDVVGHDFSDPHGIRAFVARAGGEPTQLPDLTPGGNPSIAVGINNLGDVVGQSRAASGNLHAVLWKGDEVIDLAVLAGTPLSESSVANDLNDAGQVVGRSGDRAVLWDGGAMIPLGLLAGDVSGDALAINELGQVVGQSCTGLGLCRAFLWENGSLTELDPLPGGIAATAEDINDRGQIVGTSHFAGSSRLTIWTLDLTPQQQITALQSSVEQLVITGALNDSEANGLTVKLEHALAALEGLELSAGPATRVKVLRPGFLRPRLATSAMAVVLAAYLETGQGDVRAAIQQLEGFINQAEAFVRAGKLTPSQGQPLIDLARRIIDRLEG